MRLQAFYRAPPQQPTPSVVTASMKPGQKSCLRSSGIITLSAQGPSDGSGQSRLRQGHRNYQSRLSHQCSETTLTGESWFHISPPRGFEPGSLVMGSKRVDHWTSGTVYECFEIASSPHFRFFTFSHLKGQCPCPHPCSRSCPHPCLRSCPCPWPPFPVPVPITSLSVSPFLTLS